MMIQAGRESGTEIALMSKQFKVLLIPLLCFSSARIHS
jgi:hypothetical protein